MKCNINSLKLIIPMSDLALTLMGGTIPLRTASNYPEALPLWPPAEIEQSRSDMEEGIQPLSDMDDVNKQTYI